MSKPVRIQLSRKAGFDLQAASVAANGLPAVKIDRSTGFGNPFPVQKGTSTHMGKTEPIWSVGTWNGPAMWFRQSSSEAQELSVNAFRAWICKPAQDGLRVKVGEHLRGKNLACWCKAGAPCHADVLLELANPPTL